MENKQKKIKAITIEETVHHDFQQLQLQVSMDKGKRVSSAELIRMLVNDYKDKCQV